MSQSHTIVLFALNFSTFPLDPKRELIIVPKSVWDVVNEEKEFIEGGFPIATFFVDVAPDAYCVDDMGCRFVLQFWEFSVFLDDLGSVMF